MRRASRPLGRHARAFTLLEVLAAIAILGVLYTVLAGVAIQGLRAEGESQRRLEASLLADAALVEIETAIATGAPPPLGRSESEQDPFLVEVSVAPFQLALSEPSQAPAAAGESESLLSDAEEGPLRLIEVVVTWLEGSDERSTVRTTYAYDPSLVADLLGAAGVPDGEPR